MIHILFEGKSPIILGVNWLELPLNFIERFQQKRTLIKTLKPTHALSMIRSDRAMLGVVNLRHERLPKKPISGAAWLSEAMGLDRRVVFIREITQQLFWVCVISEGLPISRGDRVVSDTSLIEVLEEIMTGHIKNEFEFFVDESHTNPISTLLQGYTEFTRTSFSRLVEYIEVNPHILKRVGFSPLQISIIIFLVMIVALATGWWRYNVLQQDKARAERLAALAHKNKGNIKSLNAEELYLKSFSDYFSNQPRYTAGMLEHYLENSLGTQALLQSGWKFSSIKCQISNKVCILQFLRQPFAENLDLSNSKFDNIQMKDNNVAAATMPIKLSSITLPDELTAQQVLILFSERDLLQKIKPFFKSLSKLGLSATISTTSNIPIHYTDSPIVIREGRWHLGGSVGLMTGLDALPVTFFVTQVEISIENATFSMDGIYWKAIKTPKLIDNEQ